jgi:Fe-S-cluster-containing dehydrogenase component
VDPDTGVRGVSERRKTPAAKQRDYVTARDQRCIGCGAPAARCQIHHIHWRRNGGPTLVDNLALVCWGCHHSIHHHNWDVDTLPDGRPTLHRPDQLRHTS